MNLKDAIQKVDQILDEERSAPTISYKPAPVAPEFASPLLVVMLSLPNERGTHPRSVRENPEWFQFKSINFDLLCAIWEQVPDHDREALIASMLSRIAKPGSFRHKWTELRSAGSWFHVSSELPLVAEFSVRRGATRPFIAALTSAAPSPGLTLLLMQVAEMIALGFTIFTDEQYKQLPLAVGGIKKTIEALRVRPKPTDTEESNTIYHVCREIPQLCEAIVSQSRKARYLYLKGSLLPGINLEINQDKAQVQTFLEKLGFSNLLIESLNEVDKHYRSGASPFDLKNSMGHLRSFLEQLHLQVCITAHTKFGGNQPSKWGETLTYLRENDVLTNKEEAFAASVYTLMSDAAVHPLIAEREYARMMRNVSIEYGLLLLTKLDKLGLK